MNEDFLRDLLDKYLTGSMTDPERTELSGLLQQPEYQSALEYILASEFESRSFEGEGYDKVMKQIETKVLTKIAKKKNKRIFLLAGWAAAAASLILIIGSYYHYYVSTSNKTEPEVAQKTIDIAPGGNKAV